MQRGKKLSGRSVPQERHRWFRKPMLLMGCAGLLAAVIGLMMVHSGWSVRATSASSIVSDKVWEDMVQERQVGGNLPLHSLVWQLEGAALQHVFDQALPDGNGALENSPAILSLPLPDGNLARFRIVDSPVLAPELAAQHPRIKSYRGQGVDNPSLTMRCSWTPGGLSALVIDGAQTVMIQPLVWFRQAPVQRDSSDQAANGSSNPRTAGGIQYVSYYGKDYTNAAEEAVCLVQGDQPNALKQRRAERRARTAAKKVAETVTLRTYRIAIATTLAYRNSVPSVPPPDDKVLVSINNWLNSVNSYLGKELAVKLMLAAPAIHNTDYSLPDSNTDATLNSIRTALKTLDPSTYDVAHLLGVGSGGNAYVGNLCETLTDSTGPYKAAGVTLVSASAPSGNLPDTLTLLHELGHQLGATHTFNADCGNGRAGDTAFELGNGATIMSVGGNCAGENIVTTRYYHFHAGSLEQITEFLDSYGGTCGTATPLSNLRPTVTATPYYVIPKLTTFTLSGTISDAQPLTYTWEQIDAGGSAFANPPYGDQAGDPPETSRPLFLPMNQAGPIPAATPVTVTRTFSGGPISGFSPTENLPAIGRSLNFRLTARDNQSSGGGVGSATVQVGVAEYAGPFFITYPNTAVNWTVGTQQTVTWEVNNTNNAPVSCANVRILFSSDGGNSFPTILANSAPNIGTYSFTVPNLSTTSTARIKIEDVENRFFDISDRNFSVNTSSCSFSLGSMSESWDQNSHSGTVTVSSNCFAWAAVSQVPWLTVTGGASGVGNGLVSYNVSQNTGAARYGTMTIGGITFTVTQVGPIHGLQFYPLPRPIRLLETRPDFSTLALQGCYRPNAKIQAGTTRTQTARGICDGFTIPTNALAITGNITVVPVAPGALTLFSSDIPQPPVENSNFNAGELTNNAFTVALSESDGAFNIYTSATTDVIVDVTGYYAPPGAGGLYYHPLPSPVRLVETRTQYAGCYQPPKLTGTNNSMADPSLDLPVQGRGPGLPTACNTIPNDAVMLVGNATTVLPTAPYGFGYLTIYPSDAVRPSIASSNYATNDVINGPFAVRVGPDGKFKVYTFSTTDLVIDISGYYSTNANDANGAGMLFNPLPKPMRLLETRSNPSNLPGCYKPNAKVLGGTAGIYPQQAWGSCANQPPLMIPNNTALAILGNVTVRNPDTFGFTGYLTFFPGNVMNSNAPTAATSNHAPTVPYGYNRHFFVGLSPTDGTFKILSQWATDLAVDVSGYFAP